MLEKKTQEIQNVDQINLLRFKKIWSTLLSIYMHTNTHATPLQTITNDNEIINTKIISYDLQRFLAPKLCFLCCVPPVFISFNSLASMLSLLVLFYFDLINTQFCFDIFFHLIFPLFYVKFCITSMFVFEIRSMEVI